MEPARSPTRRDSPAFENGLPGPALALTTSVRTPSGRVLIEVEEAALVALGATGEHDFLETYVREGERLRALALRLACLRLTSVVRISPGDLL